MSAQLVQITKTPALLGEGAFWDDTRQNLVWIDIEGKKLHAYTPATGVEQTWELPKHPGTVVPTLHGEYLLGLEDVIAIFNPKDNSYRTVASPGVKYPEVKLNDGKCDPTGRLWIGTMDNKDYKYPTACLYKMERDGKTTLVKTNVVISNGITWSSTGEKMYYIDSPTRTVVAYDFDQEKGAISNPRVVVTTPENLGTPDGSCMDAEGKLWVAQWGGACVIRWDPETGQQLAKIDLPALNVTSVAFGGEKLDTLFITTALIGNPAGKKEYEKAGHLFSTKPGVKGTKAYYFQPVEIAKLTQ